jgi:L-amino acid N-acyltransferase YncA
MLKKIFKSLSHVPSVLLVGAKYRGKGIGDALLGALIEASEKNRFWTPQVEIFPENTASIELHKKHGFRVLGTREKVGKIAFGELQGKWRDVVLMERRNKMVGVD